MKKLTKSLFVVFIFSLAMIGGCNVSESVEDLDVKPVKVEGCQGNENCGDGGSTPPPIGG